MERPVNYIEGDYAEGPVNEFEVLFEKLIVENKKNDVVGFQGQLTFKDGKVIAGAIMRNQLNPALWQLGSVAQGAAPGQERVAVLVATIFDITDVVRMDMLIGPAPPQSGIVPATRMPSGPISPPTPIR